TIANVRLAIAIIEQRGHNHLENKSLIRLEQSVVHSLNLPRIHVPQCFPRKAGRTVIVLEIEAKLEVAKLQPFALRLTEFRRKLKTCFANLRHGFNLVGDLKS